MRGQGACPVSAGPLQSIRSSPKGNIDMVLQEIQTQHSLQEIWLRCSVSAGSPCICHSSVVPRSPEREPRPEVLDGRASSAAELGGSVWNVPQLLRSFSELRPGGKSCGEVSVSPQEVTAAGGISGWTWEIRWMSCCLLGVARSQEDWKEPAHVWVMLCLQSYFRAAERLWNRALLLRRVLTMKTVGICNLGEWSTNIYRVFNKHVLGAFSVSAYARHCPGHWVFHCEQNR